MIPRTRHACRPAYTARAVRQTDDANITKNSQHLMHSMQPNNTNTQEKVYTGSMDSICTILICVHSSALHSGAAEWLQLKTYYQPNQQLSWLSHCEYWLGSSNEHRKVLRNGTLKTTIARFHITLSSQQYVSNTNYQKWHWVYYSA